MWPDPDQIFRTVFADQSDSLIDKRPDCDRELPEFKELHVEREKKLRRPAWK